jgi:hypothetical protein
MRDIFSKPRGRGYGKHTRLGHGWKQGDDNGSQGPAGPVRQIDPKDYQPAPAQQSGTTPRSTGANPRALGTNPRARGTNPRARKAAWLNQWTPEQQRAWREECRWAKERGLPVPSIREMFGPKPPLP